MKLGIIFVALLVGLFALGEPAVAAKPVPSGTIAIAAGSDLNLGGWVSFDVTTSDIGNHDARVELHCYQTGAITPDNPTGAVYVASDFANQPLLLGGTTSPWLTNGGPADCTATLYYWDFHPIQTFVQLADPIAFTAGG